MCVWLVEVKMERSDYKKKTRFLLLLLFLERRRRWFAHPQTYEAREVGLGVRERAT